MHFRISPSLSFQWKTKRRVFLLLFVLTPVHLNWPSYATGKCCRSQRQLISTMKHWWLYITIHFLTIFKRKMRNLRLNLIYLSFFVQYIMTQAKKGHFSTLKSDSKLLKSDRRSNFNSWKVTGGHFSTLKTMGSIFNVTPTTTSKLIAQTHS